MPAPGRRFCRGECPIVADFVHLHVHSAYSLSEGAIPVTRIRDMCLESAMPAIAVTDVNTLSGALEISGTLAEAGIQPVTGLQQSFRAEDFGLQHTRPAPLPSLVLLARSEYGYRNLLKISSTAFLDSASAEGPCMTTGKLSGHTGDIICLTGGYDGPVDRLLREGRNTEARKVLDRLSLMFPGHLYVEIQRHQGRKTYPGLVSMAYDAGIPLVATNEPYFPTAQDHQAHDALLCIAQGAYVHQDDRRTVTPDHYFKSADEMLRLFRDIPEATKNTLEIARRCAFYPRIREPILPRFTNSPDDTAAMEEEAAELRRQAREGLAMRMKACPERLVAEESTYRHRLDMELDTINRMGFPGYFLIVADFIKWSKKKDIPVGPGRGSGAGSLVAWALTITDLDPLRFGLLFERFLNPERVSMPDFDIDFCQERRDEVISYVQEKYGKDRVAQIITFGKLQARAVLRDVGRVLNMPFGQVDRICKLVPASPAAPVSLAEALESEPALKEMRENDDTVAALVKIALKLEGLYRHASTHAAGLVIADRPLQELVPLYLDPRSDMPATQFSMNWVESSGLVKFDFLGLKTLTIISKTVRLCRKRKIKIDIADIPYDDKKTYDMLATGSATGVFQLESTGMRSTLRGLGPDSLEDIIALISLYRPGPMENIPAYIECKKGERKPDYLHPLLEDILKETYGVIIYQEQVMQIAQTLSGYSLGEADLLRRAMGKKKKDEMRKQRHRFIKGAENRGVDPAKSSEIFDLVQKFAGYGFNKSHAAAYACIAYQTAWLKANFPAEFMAASMSLDRTNTDKLSVFINEIKSSKIKILPPHVNHSDSDFSVHDGTVVYALSAIRNTGASAMEHIVQARNEGGKFRDMIDFAQRVDLKLVGKRALENLARAGAFDGLSGSRAQALESTEFLMRLSSRTFSEKGSPQGGLFDNGKSSVLNEASLPDIDEWDFQDRLDREFMALGFYLSGHPLDIYQDILDEMHVTPCTDVRVPEGKERTFFQMAGFIHSVRIRRSKSGRPFAWVKVSDHGGEWEITVFSPVLERHRNLLETENIVLMTVTAENRDGEIRFVLENARPLEPSGISSVAGIRIYLEHGNIPDTLPEYISSLVSKNEKSGKGKIVICICIPETGQEVDISVGNEIVITPEVQRKLKSIKGVSRIQPV